MIDYHNIIVKFNEFMSGGQMTVITYIVLIVNTIALIVVAWQTYLTKKSFDITYKSFKNHERIQQLNTIPSSGNICYVRIKFDQWIKNCEKVIVLIKDVSKNNTIRCNKELYKEVEAINRGIVKRYYSEKSPDWLSELLISGASHYYNSMVAFNDMLALYIKRNNVDDILSLTVSFDNCRKNLIELRTFVTDILPEAYENTPDIQVEKLLY